MAKIQAVWAIDVGQAAVKALKLVPGETPDQVLAEAFDYVEYPKILSQPDADPDQLVREALETFLERNDLKGCKVALAVPGQSGLVKFIKLPPVEKKRIPDIVKFEARQQIPFALEEVIWAYQQIGVDEAAEEEGFTMAEVGLFAMKRDQINRAILPLRVVGVEVDIVQMGPIALYNYITFDQLKGSGSKDSIVLLDIGADNTDLIITDGTRIWQRNVPIGGNHFTRALTKELKLTFAKAEHLKRNATKAPDPRSIFTAMRGVFNDFASEVNRSIGFYSSVNRTAKISKVIGLGNGFKLPGLQKFLQQNLNHEVDKLEGFSRLVGDDVTTAPQFQENLPSFAVAYGLGVQGLNRSGLRTNLLPPEIEQVRLIRAKKPWVLAASALLMLGFASLFLGDYRALAKVSSPDFDRAVAQATATTKKGGEYKAAYEQGKNQWVAKKAEGQSLILNPTEGAVWPEFLKTLSEYLPDPVKDYKLDPNKPGDQQKLDELRVHVDAIKPVWRTDLAGEWFNSPALRASYKDYMHPLDRTPPQGEGWVVQIVGHHYNPYPTAEDLRKGAKNTHNGPYGYLVTKVLPGLTKPSLRLFGVHHVALAWLAIDREWTSEKGNLTNGLALNGVPILDRAAPPSAGGGGGGGGGGGSSDPSGLGLQSGGNDEEDFAAQRRFLRPSTVMPGGGMRSLGARRGRYAGPPPPFGLDAAKALEKSVVRRTRTDFLIQFVWQPPKPEEQPKDDKERNEKLAQIRKDLTEAEAKTKQSMVIVPQEQIKAIESKIAAESEQESAALSRALEQAEQPKAASPAASGGRPAGPAGAAPGTPAPRPPAGPAAPPAVGAGGEPAQPAPR